MYRTDAQALYAAQTMRANPEINAERAARAAGGRGAGVVPQRRGRAVDHATYAHSPANVAGQTAHGRGRQAQVGNDFANRTKYGKRLKQPSARERLDEHNSRVGQFTEKARRFGRLFVVPGAKS
jgi:hypothetical protein